jgi:ubiquinone biosynthesis protein UbiJ
MLAKLIGDTRAQSITALFELGADSALKFARSQIQEVQQASERTMSQNFTGTKDMNRLQDQLDQLRLQIDRVDARIHQLEEAKRHGA